MLSLLAVILTKVAKRLFGVFACMPEFICVDYFLSRPLLLYAVRDLQITYLK